MDYKEIALKLYSHAELACPEFRTGFQHLLTQYTDPDKSRDDSKQGFEML